MIDISAEEVRPLSQAAAWVPSFRKGKKGGHRTSGTTLWRWNLTGIAGVKLEVIYLGDTRCTSKEALKRFFEAVTAARESGRTPAGSPSARDRSEARRLKDSEQAKREFEAARGKRSVRCKAGAAT